MALPEILILNGPNLNLTGRRESAIYGIESFEEYIPRLRKLLPEVSLAYRQSNSEGTLIDILHEYGYTDGVTGIVFNPGAYSHYSYALADALRAIPTDVIEVHISNISARDDFRHRSVTAEAARAVISGLGLYGYELACRAFLHNLTVAHR